MTQVTGPPERFIYLKDGSPILKENLLNVIWCV